jgi:hypothetical protein
MTSVIATTSVNDNDNANNNISLQLQQESSLTIEALIDELYLCLAKVKSYDAQAEDLIYRIPVHKPTPIFEIKISDLSTQVKKELDDRWKYKKEIDNILKEAVGRIFANVNERYFLLSVKRLLRVRLSQS